MLETRLQNQVLVFVLDRSPLERTAQITSVRVAPDSDRKYQCAASRLRESDEAIWLITTLCSHSSDRVFLTITDGAPDVVASLLARLEAYHVETEPLDHGHTVPIVDAPFRERGLVAALFLRPKVSHALPNFPDQANFDDHHCHFLLVTFLTQREYDVKLAHGLDALLDVFEAETKDLVRFGEA